VCGGGGGVGGGKGEEKCSKCFQTKLSNLTYAYFDLSKVYFPSAL